MAIQIQKLNSFIGLARQTAGKGTAASTPVWGFGITDGKVFNVDVSQDYEDITLPGGPSDRFSPAVNRTDAKPGASFKTRGFAKSLGLLLYGALGTIAGPTTTVYTVTPAQDLPYLTLFGQFGSEYIRLQDCKIDELTISWDGRQPAEVEVSLLGTTPAYHGSSWTATNDESTQAYFGPNAGTFQIDTGGSSLAVAKLTKQSLKISNNLEGIELSKSILPDDIFPGEQVVEGSVTLEPTDLSDWLKIVTGTGTGTTQRETPIYGSFSQLLSIDASNTLTLTSTRAAFLADFPDSDPGGGAAEVEAAFQVVRPTDGSAAFTALLKNAFAGPY